MLRLVIIILSMLLCTPTLSARTRVQFTPATWNEVDTLIAHEHYTKAYNLASQLLNKASRKGDSHAMLHATHLQRTAASHYQEEHIEKTIEAYQALIPTLHGADKAVAYLLLSTALNNYKDARLGRYSDTPIALEPLTTSTLLTTPRAEMMLWDSHRIDRATRLCAEAALAEEEALRSTRTEDYDLLEPGDAMGLRLCPTLYDVVMRTLTDGMTPIYLTMDGLLPESYDLLMGTAEEFASLTLPHDSTSHTLWQLSQLQAYTRHHLTTADATLRAHLDRQRMEALEILTRDETLMSCYARGLQRIAESYAPHPTEQAMMLYLLACHYAPHIEPYTSPEQTESELQRAALMDHYTRRIGQIAPDSEWAQHATRLQQSASHPYIKLRCPNTLLPQRKATATLTVRNTESITYHIVSRLAAENSSNINPDHLMVRQPLGPGYMEARPAPCSPYAYQVMELPLPALEAGNYFLIATNNAADGAKHTSITAFTVTGLKLSVVPDNKFLAIAMAIDAATGRAVSNCTITLTEHTKKGTQLIETYTADHKGHCIIPLPIDGYRRLELCATDGTSEVRHTLLHEPNLEDTPRTTSYSLLPDRHTYMPGDQVRFTLIAYTHDTNGSHVEPHRPLTLTLRDTHSREVASLQGTTDEWGHLSGTFTLAPDATPGHYTLRVGDKQRSHAHTHFINVEAFKAPTFEAVIERPTHTVTTNDTITLRGTAITLTGMPVAGAKVQYEVQATEANLFARHLARASRVRTFSGTTTTDDKGMFSIALHTEHPSTSSTDATYSYTVTAHITDLGGETQTATTHLIVGHRTKRATFTTPNHLIMHGDSIKYSLVTLNGGRLAENITLRLSKLSTPHTDHIVSATEETERELWTEERIIKERSEHTSAQADNSVVLTRDMPCGAYRLTITYTDQGETYSEALHFELWGKGKHNASTNTLYQAQARNHEVAAGETAELYIGTRHKEVYVHYYVRVANRVVLMNTITLTDETTLLSIPIHKEWQGRMAIDLVAVKDNMVLTTSHTYLIKDPNHQLHLQLSPLTSTLEPGTTAHYTLSASDHSGNPVQAAFTLSIYNAALDAYGTNNWHITAAPTVWGRMVEIQEPQTWTWDNNTYLAPASPTTPIHYELPTASDEGDYYAFGVIRGPISRRTLMTKSNTVAAQESAADKLGSMARNDETAQPVSLHLRSNLSHTALFMPTMHTDEQGRATITLSAPDLLTTWHIKGIAHTKDLKYGHLDLSFITRKELMVQPNVPRFLYEGDTCQFTAKITHSTDEHIQVKLEVWNEDSSYTHCQSIVAEPTTQAVAFPISAPEGATSLTYRITALTTHHSDGEQGIITLLPRRTLVTETMALYGGGKEKRSFVFGSLKNNNSPTLKHHSLTLDFVSNPAWYAIEALAPLCNEENPSSERLFQRYYAATMATLIMEKYPEVEGYTDFFRRDSLSTLRNSLIERLATLQAPDGGWPWMDGFDSDPYTTMLIIKGLGELKAYATTDLIGTQEKSLIEHGILYLDKHYDDSYERMRQKPKTLDSHALYYLYTRSMHAEIAFAQGQGIAHKHYTKLLIKDKPTRGNFMQKALKMLTLISIDETQKAMKVAEVVEQSALHDEERGTYLRDNTRGWGWDRDPIATQALLIEAFTQLGKPSLIIGRMQQWLLGQKRTTQWSSSVTTAQAIHALVTGTHALPLTTTNNLDISVGTERITTTEDTHLGHTRKEWKDTEITPSLAHVEINTHAPAPSWGAMTWQYYEDIDKVKASGTGLTLTTTYYRVEHNAMGETLIPIDGSTPLTKGDRVRTLLHFATDRDMDYVELRLPRPAALEPTSTRSGYTHNYGLCHYRSVENTQTTYYFYHLGRGSYTLDCDYWVSGAGTFTCGTSTLQCMYAPEFVATAESRVLRSEK